MVKTKRLTYNRIDKKALDFLEGFPEKEAYPINIEAILDLNLKFKIIPIPNLEVLTNTVGWTCLREKKIFVDKSVYCHPKENRYRFTLAHELGHIVLHEHIFEQANEDIHSIKDLKQFIYKINHTTYRWIEYQAYSFAGAILIPRNYLLQEIDKFKTKNSLNNVSDERKLLNYLSEEFSVSNVCMRKRLKGLKMNLIREEPGNKDSFRPRSLN